jgi:8-oxo-dGTP pyrophosphatase MutT (NUDIX family)
LESTVPVRLAATAVLLRDSVGGGIEVLLLRRNATLAFAGGAWVFPGGAIDPPEIAAASSDKAAAELAVVREIQEECGLTVSSDDLVYFCHWTTPKGEKRCFATWFFAANVTGNAGDILIDGSEIHEFRWLDVDEAISLHHSDNLVLMPPTYLSLSLIANYTSAEMACSALKLRQPYAVTPRLCQQDGMMVCLYPGDSGYESIDANLSGPRHRTFFTPKGTQYEHSGSDVGVPPMDQP